MSFVPRRSTPPRAPVAALLLLLAGCATAPPPANRPAAAPAAPASSASSTSRTAALLAINDVYRIEGVERGTVGGMPRFRTLRAELEREHPELLVLHAGDALFPSLLSRTFNGEQMIDVLNALDGAPDAFDERMFAVFGNHEFDRDTLEDAPLLDGHVEESQFRWVNGNVEFVAGADGQPVVAGENLAPTWLVEQRRHPRRHLRAHGGQQAARVRRRGSSTRWRRPASSPPRCAARAPKWSWRSPTSTPATTGGSCARSAPAGPTSWSAATTTRAWPARWTADWCSSPTPTPARRGSSS